MYNSIKKEEKHNHIGKIKETRFLQINADRKALIKVLKRKKYAILTAVTMVLLVHMLTDEGGRLFQKYAVSVFATVLLVNTIFKMVINNANITFLLSDTKFILNNKYVLDYPRNSIPTCITKSDDNRFWYFLYNGKKVHTEYILPYNDLIERVTTWLSNDTNADNRPKAIPESKTVNQQLIESIKDLFASNEQLAGKDKSGTYDKNKFSFIRRINALWLILWTLLLPAAIEIVLIVIALNAKLTPLKLIAIIVALLSLYGLLQILFVFISNFFLKPYQSWCNRYLGDDNKQ